MRLGELRSMKVHGISFLGEGGGRVSEEVETLGEALPPLNYQLPKTVKNYYAVFLFRDPPPPLPEFLDPPLI